MTKSKKLLKLEKKLFETAITWGGYGIISNQDSPAFQAILEKMYTIVYKEGWEDADLWIQANRHTEI